MSLKHMFFAAALAFGAQTAFADQLCHSDGSGCMNITWDCGSFAVSEDSMCIETIISASVGAQKEALNGGGSLGFGGVEADAAEMRRKPKKAVILPDPRLQ